MSPARPRLKAQQREWLAAACLKNADELVTEALLMAAGSVPRGSFLVLSAFEELLKALYCESGEDADDVKTFWTTFRSHERKVALAQRDFGLQEPAEASYDHLLNLRERCLYVDVFHDGRTLTPNGLVQPGGFYGRLGGLDPRGD